MLSVGKRGGAALAAGARAADCPVAELRARADFSLRVTGIDCVNLAGGIVWYAGSGRCRDTVLKSCLHHVLTEQARSGRRE